MSYVVHTLIKGTMKKTLLSDNSQRQSSKANMRQLCVIKSSCIYIIYIYRCLTGIVDLFSVHVLPCFSLASSPSAKRKVANLGSSAKSSDTKAFESPNCAARCCSAHGTHTCFESVPCTTTGETGRKKAHIDSTGRKCDQIKRGVEEPWWFCSLPEEFPMGPFGYLDIYIYIYIYLHI